MPLLVHDPFPRMFRHSRELAHLADYYVYSTPARQGLLGIIDSHEAEHAELSNRKFNAIALKEFALIDSLFSKALMHASGSHRQVIFLSQPQYQNQSLAVHK